jgi:hypothetical protein
MSKSLLWQSMPIALPLLIPPALTAVSCQLITGGNAAGSGNSTQTLAQIIVNDYISQVQGCRVRPGGSVVEQ